jgi:predicted SnoaL-like aldol condensation-catalyzing enzyme
MNEMLEANKRVVLDFFRTAFIERAPEKAIRLYAGNYYRQHNPFFPDGKEGFIEKTNEWTGDKFNRKFEFKRVIAEGDYVVLHLQQILAEDDKDFGDAPNGIAVIDIFRLEAGKIVEHWDVLQAVPAAPSNDNTMF